MSVDKAEALVSSEAPLHQKRQERLQAVSDETLIDLDDYTMMLVAKAQVIVISTRVNTPRRHKSHANNS